MPTNLLQALPQDRISSFTRPYYQSVCTVWRGYNASRQITYRHQLLDISRTSGIIGSGQMLKFDLLHRDQGDLNGRLSRDSRWCNA